MFWKTLAAIFILIIGGFIYSSFQFRSELMLFLKASEPESIKPPEHDLILVEFLDYSCEGCRNLHPIITEAIKKDGKIHYIPRPLVSPDIPITRDIILFLYASAHQGAFELVHNKIYELWPIENLDGLFAYAKSLGLDTTKLRDDMENNPEVEFSLDINQKFYDQWNLPAMPLVFIGTQTLGVKNIWMPDGKPITVELFENKFKELRGWF